MRRGTWMMPVALAAAACLCGCRPDPDAEDSAPPTRQSVTFEGKVDPRFAGTWKTQNGYSILELSKDGGLKSETISFSQKGKSDTKVAGDWRVNGNDLVLRYSDKSGTTVMKYGAKLSGNKLDLAMAGGRIKITYTRQK